MKAIFLILSLSLLIVGCGSDDPELDPSTSGEFYCTINGDYWEANGFNNTLLHMTTGTPTGKRLDLRGQDDDGFMIVLSMAITSSSTGDDMPITTYETSSLEFEALITVMQGATTVLAMSAGYPGADDYGSITITELDPEAKTCSGTFEGGAMNFSSDEVEYVITGGVFTDMIYL